MMGMSLGNSEWLATFPSIKIKVSNSDIFFCVPPEQYYFASTSKVLCIGFFKYPSFVIGTNAMAGFNFVFDAENSRIGIARAQCDDNVTECCGECAKNQSGRTQVCIYNRLSVRSIALLAFRTQGPSAEF
jgi:hypothetical protein